MEEALIVTSVLVASTNAAVICMVIFIKELRTFTNYFVLSLAVSDMLTGAVFLPLHIAPYTKLTDFFVFIIIVSGAMNLCAVTWDRYVAVIKPFEYKHKLQMSHRKILVAIWLVANLCTLIPLAWQGNDMLIIHKSFVVLTLVTFVIIPYAFIIVAYLRIWLRLRSHAAQMKRMDTTNEQREGARRASLEGKTVKVFLVVVSVFLVSWLPVIYMTVVIVVLDRPDFVPGHLRNISLLTIGGSSLFNPIFYALMKTDFKEKLASMVHFAVGYFGKL